MKEHPPLSFKLGKRRAIAFLVRTYICILFLASHTCSRPYLLQPLRKVSEEYYFEYLSPLDDNDLTPDPEVSPGLFEGDIAGLSPEIFFRLGLSWDAFPERKWPNATVPYAISPKYLPDERQIIETAISTLSFFTCIDFIPWGGLQEDYILIWPVERPTGCWSFVGRRGGQQVVSLQRPDHKSLRCFRTLGKPIHELLHALGIFHEQARADRDNHVTIMTDNIHPSRLHNFKKQSVENTSFPLPYDYDSVMHYGSHFFSTSRSRPTIVPKTVGAKIGQREMMSKGDCLKLNELYGCLDKEPFLSDKYRAFCEYLAL